MTTTSSAHRLSELTERLDITPGERAWLSEQLSQVSPEHAMRGLVLRSSAQQVERHHGLDAREAYEAFIAEVGQFREFAMIPYTSFVLLYAYLSRLYLPEESLVESLRGYTRERTARTTDNPLIKIAQTNTGDDVKAFVQLQIEAFRNWQNFAQLRLISETERSLTLRYDEHYTALAQPTTQGLMEGILTLFDREGEVRFDPHSAHSFSLIMTW